MAVHKELYIDWKKGAVGEAFTKELCDTSDKLLATMANRSHCDNDQDMWIRGALWAISAMGVWEPEFIVEGGEDGVQD